MEREINRDSNQGCLEEEMGQFQRQGLSGASTTDAGCLGIGNSQLQDLPLLGWEGLAQKCSANQLSGSV